LPPPGGAHHAPARAPAWWAWARPPPTTGSHLHGGRGACMGITVAPRSPLARASAAPRPRPRT
jgi:hypothetical protein